MAIEALVKKWFHIWEDGDYWNIPVAEHFKHTSPFGTIGGEKAYLDLVKANEDKFLGNQIEIHDALYEDARACIRYTITQGEDFSMDVSEWIYQSDELIEEIISYYHIGEIREDRKLSDPE